MPFRVILLGDYVQSHHLSSLKHWKQWQELGLQPGFIPISRLRLINKACTYGTIGIKKMFRTEQLANFIYE